MKAEEWDSNNAHAILLRSHKLQESEIDVSVRAIARCGAGTNNVPVARMTEIGIPVFNTPGANANAVKELVLCGLLLGSRKIVDGVNHMKDLGSKGLAKERVEKVSRDVIAHRLKMMSITDSCPFFDIINRTRLCSEDRKSVEKLLQLLALVTLVPQLLEMLQH